MMDRLLTAGLCGNTLGQDIQTLTYHSSTSNMAFHLKDVCSSNFTWPLNIKSSQVELYCHSATCVDIQRDEMSCLTGPRCYINTDIQHEVKTV